MVQQVAPVPVVSVSGQSQLGVEPRIESPAENEIHGSRKDNRTSLV
jgi:hypothetical protein